MNSRAEYFRNNQIALRACILYDCMDGKPVYQAYQHLCAKIGGDIIDYPEFEFWFMRFARGELDINYDRSLEPKTRTFSDLPAEIIKIIGQELNFSDRLVLRHVSKYLREIADNSIPRFKNASLEIDHNFAVLTFDKFRFVYKAHMEYRCSYWNLALKDLFTTLQNPNNRLEKLTVKISIGDMTGRKFENMLKKIMATDLKIKAPIIEISSECYGGEMTILPFLEPGTAKEITININEQNWGFELPYFGKRIERISQLEQCQQSENFTLSFCYYQPSSFPIQHFLSFTNLNLHFHFRLTFSISDILRFTNILTKSTRLKSFSLTSFCDFTINDLKYQFGENALKIPGRPDVRHFRIPNSNEYFELVLNLSHDYKIDLTLKRMS